MASTFTPEERQFLGAGTRTGMVAYTASDGRPLAAPVWFVLDGDHLVFTTPAGSAKAAAMRRDPRVTLCVDLARPPYAFVQVQGTVTLSEDLATLVRYATMIGGRYMGADRAEEFGRRNAVPGELLVRVTPRKVISVMNMTG